MTDEKKCPFCGAKGEDMVYGMKFDCGSWNPDVLASYWQTACPICGKPYRQTVAGVPNGACCRICGRYVCKGCIDQGQCSSCRPGPEGQSYAEEKPDAV